MKKKTFTALALMLFIVIAIVPSGSVEASSGRFSITPVFPENQNPETRGFFDLIVTPGQKQDLVVIVSNSNNVEITVQFNLFSATTNQNGIVDYTSPGVSDTSLRYPIEEIATFDQEMVKLDANSRREVIITLDLPDETIEGTILGVIRATRELTEEEEATPGMIVNHFNSDIIIRIQQTNTPIEVDFLLGDVRMELVNHRAAIVADIRNYKPRMVTGVTGSAQVYASGRDEPIFNMTDAKIDFAPNSVYPFSLVDRAGYGIRAGQYLIKIKLEHDGKNWEFEQGFEIGAEEALAINSSALNQQRPRDLPLWALITAGVCIVLLAAVVSLLIKMKKTNSEAYAILRQQRLVSSGQQRRAEPEAEPEDEPFISNRQRRTVVQGFVPPTISERPATPVMASLEPQPPAESYKPVAPIVPGTPAVFSTQAVTHRPATIKPLPDSGNTIGNLVQTDLEELMALLQKARQKEQADENS